MTEFIDTILYKLRFVGVGVLILFSLVFLLYLIPAGTAIFADGSLQARNTRTYTSSNGLLSDANIITSSMAKMANDFGNITSSTGNMIEGSILSTASVITEGGRTVGQSTFSTAKSAYTGIAFSVQKISSGIGFVAQKTGGGIVLILRTPVNAMGFVMDSAAISTVIRPSTNSEVPVIDSQLSSLFPEQAGMARTEPETHPETVWPINGRVTTLFGIPHQPYQNIHTGIDISSGLSSGKTTVKPFRAGQVVKIVHAKTGLGNHIVVDHGEGVSSLYAHLYSISVKTNQQVNSNTILGYEGSTGMSTGTHLHFEIRVNGQPIDPKQFIANNP